MGFGVLEERVGVTLLAARSEEGVPGTCVRKAGWALGQWEEEERLAAVPRRGEMRRAGAAGRGIAEVPGRPRPLCDCPRDRYPAGA